MVNAKDGQPREFLTALPKYGNCVALPSPVMPRAGLSDSSDRPSSTARLYGRRNMDGTIMKKIAVTVAVLALGLAACQPQADEAAANNDSAVENAAEADVNAAVDASNVADNALDAAGNAIENAGEAVDNAADAVENTAE